MEIYFFLLVIVLAINLGVLLHQRTIHLIEMAMQYSSKPHIPHK